MEHCAQRSAYPAAELSWLAFLLNEGLLVRPVSSERWFLSLGPMGNAAVGWPVVLSSASGATPFVQFPTE
eukprot:7968923-Alexandrium_andersonii.AAC.1